MGAYIYATMEVYMHICVYTDHGNIYSCACIPQFCVCFSKCATVLSVYENFVVPVFECIYTAVNSVSTCKWCV